MLKSEAIKKLEMVHYELTTLIPRLTPMFAKNAEQCRIALGEVMDAMRGQVRGGVRQGLVDDDE